MSPAEMVREQQSIRRTLELRLEVGKVRALLLECDSKLVGLHNNPLVAPELIAADNECLLRLLLDAGSALTQMRERLDAIKSEVRK